MPQGLPNSLGIVQAVQNGLQLPGITNSMDTERLLIQLEDDAFNLPFDDLYYERVLPVSYSQSLAIAGFSHNAYDITGKAKIIGNYSEDMPSATYSESKAKSGVAMLGVSYHYNIVELARAQALGVPLEENRAEAARFAMESALDDIAFYGAPDNGLYGLFNHPNVGLTSAPPNAGATSTKWADKSADEILADIHQMMAIVTEGSKGRLTPTDLYIPLTHFNLISMARIPGSDKTVYRWLIENSPYISEGMIKPLLKCAGAGAGGVDIAITMVKNKRWIDFKVPYAPSFLQSMISPMSFKRPMIATCGGLIVRDQSACLIMEGI